MLSKLGAHERNVAHSTEHTINTMPLLWSCVDCQPLCTLLPGQLQCAAPCRKCVHTLLRSQATVYFRTETSVYCYPNCTILTVFWN